MSKKPRKKSPLKTGPNQKRGRRERLAAKVHKVVKLFRSEDREKLLVDGEEHYIEGSIAGWQFISVPETITNAMAEALKQKAQAILNQPVVIITHNVEFVVTKELPPKEAAAVIKRAEDDTTDALASAEAGEESDGNRPRLGLIGGGDSGSDDEADSGDGDDGEDEAPGEDLEDPEGDGQEDGTRGDSEGEGEGEGASR